MRVRRGVKGVGRKREIGVGGNGSGRGVVVNWRAAESGKGDGGVGRIAEEIRVRRKDMVERESRVVV